MNDSRISLRQVTHSSQLIDITYRSIDWLSVRNLSVSACSASLLTTALHWTYQLDWKSANQSNMDVDHTCEGSRQASELYTCLDVLLSCSTHFTKKKLSLKIFTSSDHQRWLSFVEKVRHCVNTCTRLVCPFSIFHFVSTSLYIVFHWNHWLASDSIRLIWFNCNAC